MPDSSQFYFPELRGESYLRYLPNTDHSLKGAYVDAAEGALTFYQIGFNEYPASELQLKYPAIAAAIASLPARQAAGLSEVLQFARRPAGPVCSRLSAGGERIRTVGSAMCLHRRQRGGGVTPPDPGGEWRLLGPPPDNSIGMPRPATA